ncbi:MAG: UvrD-helicase domain-containing protein [Legionellaceae bacterium]|nr:UvrD-helicase domain-containing protein [Legionellaceae bacterium]
MLNPQQEAAVRYIDGPLLVLAGAGSGKTRVITQKIAWLIEQCGYAARHICAVTFTNKAAAEMRQRIAQTLAATERRGLKIATFHTLGLQIIRRHQAACQLKAGFSIFDSTDCLQLIRHYLPTGHANEREFPLQVQQQISRWKNELLSSAQVSQLIPQDEWAEAAQGIYPRYLAALAAYNAVDFDDLIRLPVQLLREDATVRDYWQNRIRHLLIDEYQDSNTSQYELVKMLTGVRASFTVVGDDDQSIYAWRGARPENLAQLQKDFPRLKVIKLEQNYRSTSRILQAANQLISNNPHLFSKALWSKLGVGEPLRVVVCRDEQDEAEQVVADLISHKLKHGRAFHEYAILYRGNHQSRVFEKVLRHHSVPYSISGGQSWFARSEIKDIFAYCRLLANEADDAAFLRAINSPRRGVGETSLAQLGHYAQQRGLSLLQAADHLALKERITDKPYAALVAFKQWLGQVKQNLKEGSLQEGLRHMIEDSGYEASLYEQSDNATKAERRMNQVWELVEWIGRLQAKAPQSTLGDIVNKLILIDILEQNEEESDNVQLMTLHASKGLEFPFVYLVGMEEELLPHRSSMESDDIAEERRLAYVGLTRAQKELCMTLARQRRRAGERYDCQPSRFLEELPADSLEWFGKNSQRCPEKAKATATAHLAGLKALLR